MSDIEIKIAKFFGSLLWKEHLKPYIEMCKPDGKCGYIIINNVNNFAFYNLVEPEIGEFHYTIGNKDNKDTRIAVKIRTKGLHESGVFIVNDDLSNVEIVLGDNHEWYYSKIKTEWVRSLNTDPLPLTKIPSAGGRRTRRNRNRKSKSKSQKRR